MNTFTALTEWLATHPLLGVLGILCSIVSVPLSVYLSLKGQKQKQPRFAIRSYNIVRQLVSTIPSLQMTYFGYGGAIDNFTVTKILFWNAGNETIHKQDVAKSEPVSIYAIDNAVILDAGIIQKTNNANQFEVKQSRDRDHVTLCFDYLDKGDGAVIQIFHPGRSSTQLQLRGMIKGAGKPRGQKFYPKLTTNFKYYFVLMSCMAVLLCCLSLYSVMYGDTIFTDVSRSPRSRMFNLFTSFLPVAFVIAMGVRLLRRRPPKQFRNYSEPFYDE